MIVCTVWAGVGVGESVNVAGSTNAQGPVPPFSGVRKCECACDDEEVGGGRFAKDAVDREMDITAGEFPAESYALPIFFAFSFAKGRTGGRSGDEGAEDSAVPGRSSFD